MIMTLSVSGKVESLAEVGQWVDDFTSKSSLTASNNFALQLCCEEVVSNIVKYGSLPQEMADHQTSTIELSLKAEGHIVELKVEDSGIAFNPLESTEPGHPSNLNEAKVGGLGISLIKKFSKNIKYERKNFKNCLFLFFDFSPKPAAS